MGTFPGAQSATFPDEMIAAFGIKHNTVYDPSRHTWRGAGGEIVPIGRKTFYQIQMFCPKPQTGIKVNVALAYAGFANDETQENRDTEQREVLAMRLAAGDA